MLQQEREIQYIYIVASVAWTLFQEAHREIVIRPGQRRIEYSARHFQSGHLVSARPRS